MLSTKKNETNKIRFYVIFMLFNASLLGQSKISDERINLDEKLGKITGINGHTVEMLTLKKTGIKTNDIVYARNGKDWIRIKITYVTHTTSTGTVIEGDPGELLKGLYIYGQAKIKITKELQPV